MNSTTRATLLLLGLCGVAHADVQRWPFSFDTSLAADPATATAVASGSASLPVLPVAELQEVDTDGGAMKLWFWPESARLLQGIAAAGMTPMVWPTAPTRCVQTAAFSVPTLLLPGASGACTTADSSIRASLADLSACTLVDRPELYVLTYDPTKARQSTDSLEDLIGLAGEGFSHVGPPPDGILPADFVPTLRTIILKLRNDKLAAGIATAKAKYATALSTATSNAACFDATALASLTAGLTALQAELDASAAYLTMLRTAGEAAFTHDDLCLAASSRIRNTLSVAVLSIAERKFIAFWLGGVYWRMRGGGLIPLGSTQDARLYFLQHAFARIGEILGGQDGVDAATNFYTQVIIDGWGDWMDMGHTAGGGDKYADLVGMTQRGQRQAKVAADTLGPRGYDTTDLIAAGLQMGPGYYYAWAAAPTFLYASPLSPPYSGYIDGPTAIGEFNIGASLGLGLAQTLLPGKPTGAAPTVLLCTGRVCGDDGCGGSCGTCDAGLTCVSGQCTNGVDGGGSSDGGVVDGHDAGGTTTTKSSGCAMAGHRTPVPSWPLAQLLLLFVALRIASRRSRSW